MPRFLHEDDMPRFLPTLFLTLTVAWVHGLLLWGLKHALPSPQKFSLPSPVQQYPVLLAHAKISSTPFIFSAAENPPDKPLPPVPHPLSFQPPPSALSRTKIEKMQPLALSEQGGETQHEDTQTLGFVESAGVNAALSPEKTITSPAYCQSHRKPLYPSLSVAYQEEGSVQLQVSISGSGRMDHVLILTPSPYSRLNHAAVASARSWRCMPALQEGRAQPSILLRWVHFRLQDG